MMGTRVRVTSFKIKLEQEKYMKCNFSTNLIMRGIIKIKEKEIASSGCFKYLESTFQSSDNI